MTETKTPEEIEKRLEHITTPITLSVIGCFANGLGDALMADIGFIDGGRGTHQVYIGGETAHRLMGRDQIIVNHLVNLVEEKVLSIQGTQEDKNRIAVGEWK